MGIANRKVFQTKKRGWGLTGKAPEKTMTPPDHVGLFRNAKTAKGRGIPDEILNLQRGTNPARCLAPVIPALRRLRQGDCCEFGSSLCYRMCPKPVSLS